MDQAPRTPPFQPMLDRPRGNAFLRPNAIMQIALELWAQSARTGPYADVQMLLGPPLDGLRQPIATFGFESPEVILAVGRGELDLATLNPSALLTMAYRGTGPFAEPLPLRAIAIMPSYDLMGFGLSGQTGLTSLAEVRERKYPLRVSLRDDPSHSPILAAEQVLQAEGIAFADIEAWGGSISLVPNAPGHPSRINGMRSGEIDAVFDEGINSWGPPAMEAGFRFARLSDSALAELEKAGWPLLPMSARFPQLKGEADPLTISFSGWPLYTHAGLDEDLAYRITDALWRSRGNLTWDIDRPVELTDLCGGTPAAPIGVPLHPGAERFYREQGVVK